MTSDFKSPALRQNTSDSVRSSWLHRWNLSSKFAAIGFISLVMLAIPLSLYFKRTYAEIATAQR